MTDSTLDIKLRNIPLEYRSKLTIPSKVNFGLELELDKINYDEIYHLVRKQFGSNWRIKTDKSLTDGQNAEIVSPVLQNTKQTWILLKKLGGLLEQINPSYDNCSFQVNFDGKLLPGLEDKVRFLKLFAMYEDIIYRFSKGEDLEYRESLEIYASPIILALKGALSIGSASAVEMFSDNKRYGVVFKNGNRNLIEVRTPNATSNPILWQNYITTFYYLLKFSTSNKYNKREVDKYIDDFYKIYLLEGYELEKRDKALKFSNMLFTHSVDQIFFMHQYLGEDYKSKEKFGSYMDTLNKEKDAKVLRRSGGRINTTNRA